MSSAKCLWFELDLAREQSVIAIKAMRSEGRFTTGGTGRVCALGGLLQADAAVCRDVRAEMDRTPTGGMGPTRKPVIGALRRPAAICQIGRMVIYELPSFASCLRQEYLRRRPAASTLVDIQRAPESKP